MFSTTLLLPERPPKPRTAGCSMVIDGGLPTTAFTDLIESHGELIDVLKFGWGTCLVTADLQRKIDVLTANGVGFYFGGTLFEKYVYQGAFDDWRRFVDRFGCRAVEISNGTIPMSNTRKADYIRAVAGDYTVYSEVGFKDPGRSEMMRPAVWIADINEDLSAGADKVITEARETGRGGICRSNGEPRYGLIEEIAESGIDRHRLLWEAPSRDLQILLLRLFGPEVNLGNIATDDVVGLETLRLGLRSDTLLDWDKDHPATSQDPSDRPGGSGPGGRGGADRRLGGPTDA